MSPLTVLVDLAAVTGAGQQTRAEQFVRHVRLFDTGSKFIVVKQSGALNRIDWSSIQAEVIEAPQFKGLIAGIRRMLWEMVWLPRIERRKRADVFLTFSHYLPPGIRAPSRVVGVSNLAPFSRAAWLTASRVERARLTLLRWSILSSTRRATKVLALSRMCRRILVEHGIDEAKILVVSNGSDAMPASGAPRLQRSNQVLCVSHFYTYKNFETLLDGFASLPPRIRDSHELLVIGPPVDARYYSRILRKARALPLARIRIIPGLPRVELSNLYCSCAAFVFPSLVENSPNVLLEAMAHGAACVVSSAEPMPEYSGDAALYFDPLSAADLCRQLTRVLSDPCLRESLGRHAEQTASRFRWEDLVRTTVLAYCEPLSLTSAA
jgi:glycosyltransferase involved in cell wall biosynthesis